MAVGAAMMALPAAIQGGTALMQLIKGWQMGKNNQRPEYQIPDGIKQNLSQAQMQSLRGLPAESVRMFTEMMQRNMNTGLNAMGDRKAGLSGLSGLVQNANDAANTLTVQDANARQVNLNNLMDARKTMAGYEDKAFELNKLQPYQETAAAASALKGAGMQNIYGAATAGADMIGDKMVGDAMSGANGKIPSQTGTQPNAMDNPYLRYRGQYEMARSNGYKKGYVDWLQEMGYSTN